MLKAFEAIKILKVSVFTGKRCLLFYTTRVKPFNEIVNYEVSDQLTKEIFLKDFQIFNDFITPSEEDSLFNELEPHLKRLRYEKSHWDDAIHNYRETEKLNWQQRNIPIIERMHQSAFGPAEERTEPVFRQTHVLDLAATGVIKPHVDSIKFCGGIVAGLSLLSDCVIRFVRESDKGCWANAYLPRYSFYVMRGDIRHLFTHEILSNDATGCSVNGVTVHKTRRISLMCRNEPPQPPSSPAILDSLLKLSTTVLPNEQGDDKVQ